MGYMSQYATATSTKRKATRAKPRPKKKAMTQSRRVGRRIPAVSRKVSRTVIRPVNYAQHEWTTVSSSMGRYKRPTLNGLARYIRRQSEPTIFRWNGLSATYNDRGLYGIGRQDDAVTSPAFELLPMYVADLTAIRNIVNGTEAAAQAVYRAKVSKTSGSIAWDGQLHADAAGSSTSTAMLLEASGSTSNTINTPHQVSLLKWLDIRMNLWGCVAKPTRFVVQLVKLLDEDVDPFVTPGNANIHNAFWQSLVKPYAFNPIATARFPGGLKRYMNVLKTYTVNFDAQNTSDVDLDPKTQTLKWFLKRDEFIDFRNRANTFANSTNLTSDEDFLVQTAQCSTQPRTRGKLLLLIRAAAYVANTAETSSTDNILTPSFDLVFRSCYLTGSS